MKISVVMPALNEEKNIIQAINGTLSAFRALDINGEIIVVNDGSADNTESLVLDAVKKDERIRLLSHNAPQGVGASFWRGVDSAGGDVVVFIPGDNENIPLEILRYRNLLEHVDIVIPYIFNNSARSLFRNTLSYIYRFIVNTTFAVNFNYTNGTILYRKSLLSELTYRSKGFFFQTDILIRTVKKGYLFAEVPLKLNARKHGETKAVNFPSLMKVVKGYLRLVKELYLNKGVKIASFFSEDSLTESRRR